MIHQLREEAEQVEPLADGLTPRKGADLTIVELLAGYWPHAEKEYRKHDEPTRTLDNNRAR